MSFDSLFVCGVSCVLLDLVEVLRTHARVRTHSTGDRCIACKQLLAHIQ